MHIRHPKTKEVIEFDDKLRSSTYMQMLFKDGWEEVEAVSKNFRGGTFLTWRVKKSKVI